MQFGRITIDPVVCTGKPCIRGLRFPVSRLLGLLASGETKKSICQSYPYLEPEDIDEALRYAACLAEEETVDSLKRIGSRDRRGRQDPSAQNALAALTPPPSHLSSC